MKAEQATTVPPLEEKPRNTDGRDRLVINVLSSWGGQFIRIASGFLMPRIIDGQMGQEALGVWDVAWSVVAHIALVQAGVSGSVNRYVARHQAARDFAGINRVVSSVAGVMRVMGATVLVLTAIGAVCLDSLTGNSLGIHLETAKWVVLILGANTALQLSTGMYGGVITGYHRWDVHNGVHAISNALMLVGGIAVLMAGGGLIGLAGVCFGTELLGRLARWHYARVLCPTLSIRWRHFDWATARDMMRFGGSMFLVQVSQILFTQTLNILIGWHFGPAMVALFARPSALLRHVEALISKYANVLVPTASVVHSSGSAEKQRELLIQASRTGALICLPVLVFFGVLGDDLIRLWMGNDYVLPGLMLTLCLGWFAYLVHIPLFNVLSGFDLHAPVGLANVIAAAIALPCAWLAVAWHGSLVVVASVAMAPLAFMNALWMPLYACRKLQLNPLQYLKKVWLTPLMSVLPFLLAVIIVRALFPHSPARTILLGTGAGGAVLAITYWHCALTESLRSKLQRRFIGKVEPAAT